MAFDFDIEYVNALSSLRFYKESKDKTEEELLHWVETDVLFLDRMGVET